MTGTCPVSLSPLRRFDLDLPDLVFLSCRSRTVFMTAAPMRERGSKAQVKASMAEWRQAHADLCGAGLMDRLGPKPPKPEAAERSTSIRFPGPQPNSHQPSTFIG